ncbi:EAL domain-containing protein [Pseudogemmatithrix spongiicola]|uniref:EAL domain-containing protein n=1 Tax=Pseudogemmatithrix spongiicola TaxID=3062599 RepID=A0AA49Q8M3_9BACT|nr:EAL domain-containing protein [Gemmatimonadaceae bacterium 'strain 138']WKW15926.1 EAL domain-containing protein [Gemmatimonadaceae bacterium 'strain 318']
MSVLILSLALAAAAACSAWLYRRLRRLQSELDAQTAGAAAALVQAEGRRIAQRSSGEWLLLPARSAQEALWDWDLADDRIRFSARWREMLGLPPEEVLTVADEWRSRVHPADRAQVLVDIAAQTAGTGDRFSSEHRVRHQSGRWLTLQWSGLIVRDHDGKAIRVAGSVRDATAQRSVEEQARRDAFYDTITGLPNRALGLDLLRRAITRTRRQGERRFAALVVDIDRFKAQNDALGHGAGDALLQAFARRLGTAVRPGDVVARLGADVFVLVLDAVHEPDEAERVADRVHLLLKEPLRVLSHDLVITASIGIALHDPSTETAADYVRNGELAMLEAKALGGARHVVYRAEMREGVRHRASLEHDLRTAIARGEMMVWYQPVFSARDGATTTLAGFEALLRWAHPSRGLLGPGEFVPVAEETGMIVPLGTWALGEACRHLMALAPNGPHAPWVSVNLAAKQLADPALIEIVDRALDVSGLEPRRLRLEVTENVILSDEDGARRALETLRARGIGILMDDFGTGHASLSYLHRLPIGSIKIDRYFVGRMDVSAECLEIVRSVITLAKSLSMDVVAEGVEQEAQLTQLKALGCEHVQGFLLSHPLRPEETRAMLAPALRVAAS